MMTYAIVETYRTLYLGLQSADEKAMLKTGWDQCPAMMFPRGRHERAIGRQRGSKRERKRGQPIKGSIDRLMVHASSTALTSINADLAKRERRQLSQGSEI